MNSIRTLIVDDEAHAINLLTKVLAMFENNVELVGTAESIPDAVQQIHAKNPDLVFLDINMPKYTGLQINDFFPDPRPFEIIYVTAHTHHVLDALRLDAFDYIYKPIDIDTLKSTLSRLDRHLSKEQASHRTSIQDHPSLPDLSNLKLEVSTHKGVHFIPLENVLCLEASGMYCVIHTPAEQFVVSKPMAHFDNLYPDVLFRVNRSFLVNKKFVKSILTQNGYEVLLENGKTLPLSRSKKQEFIQFMK